MYSGRKINSKCFIGLFEIQLILPATPGFSWLLCWAPDETATASQYFYSEKPTQNHNQHSQDVLSKQKRRNH